MKGLSLRKKLIIVFAALFLAAAWVYLSPPESSSVKAEVTTAGGLVFENGSITGYEGTSSTVVIPSSINGQKVKSIDAAFTYNDIIKQVVVGDGITALTNQAFFYCPNLEKITLPASINNITEGSLAAGEKLSQIIIDENNTSYILVDNIVYNMDQTTIIQHVCADPITTFTPASTVTKIDSLAFAFSDSLVSVTIPATVTAIGYGPFALCSSLDTITVDASNPNYQSIDGILFSKDGEILIQYPSNKPDETYLVPDDVVTLDTCSFSECPALTTIELSKTVETFYGAFNANDTLLNANVHANNEMYSSSDGILLSKDGTTLYYYPPGRETANYTVPAGITTIGSGAFLAHPYIETLVLNEDVTSISMFGILLCPNLTKIFIPYNTTHIGFLSIIGIDEMKIWGYSQSVAEEYATEWEIPFVTVGDTNLWTYTDNGDGTCEITGYLGEEEHVYVPSVLDNLWVHTVAHTTFSECAAIEYLTFCESVNTIEASDNEGSTYIFEDCVKLREVYLPASLEKFVTYTALHDPFKGCSALVNVSVDKDSKSFYDVDGVLFLSTKTLMLYPSGRTSSSYSIPSGTTGISYTAFDNNNLETVTVPGTITSLNYGSGDTFKNNIKTIYLSNGITSVDDVFSDNVPKDIHFPETIEHVEGFSVECPHTFYVFENTAAHTYAVENNIKYVLLCKVAFDSDGGSAVDSQIVVSGSMLEEPSAITKEGYIHKGWFTDAELTTQWDFAADTVAHSMTLYSMWIEGYPITYHMNGGVNSSKNPDYYVAGKLMFLENPTKENYTFDGWYTDSSCELKYIFEAIETYTTGPIELWADWWIIHAPPSDDEDDHGSSGGNNSSGSSIDSSALSDERSPEITQKDFPDQISYMREGQTITVSGKLYMKYADVMEIAATYSGQNEKLYKYKDGDKRLTYFKYSHTFEVDQYSFYTTDKYIITVRLSDGKFFQHIIPIYKYSIVTEVLNAPRGDIYMNSEKSYELRTMAIAKNSFDIVKASYEVTTPELCKIENNVIEPLAGGTAAIKTIVLLEDGTKVEYEDEFTIIDKTANEPSELEKELMCPCYGDHCTGFPEDGIDPNLIELIEKIRAECDVPVYIISGYRCPEYNESIGGEPDSEHVYGRAADLWTDAISLDELYEICDRLNTNGGVGRYEDHVHVDTREAYIRWEDE